MTGVRSDSLRAVCYPTPLALDASSRSALGLIPSHSPHTDPRELRDDVEILRGEIGPVDEVILPVYVPEASATTEQLTPPAALRALLENATNLSRAGDHGFRALCQLAEDVLVTRVVHGDARAVADSILGRSTNAG
jgi:hypothetical protein